MSLEKIKKDKPPKLQKAQKLLKYLIGRPGSMCFKKIFLMAWLSDKDRDIKRGKAY